MSSTALADLLAGRRNYGLIIQPGRGDIEDVFGCMKFKAQSSYLASNPIGSGDGDESDLKLGQVYRGDVLGSDNFALTPEIRKALDANRRADGRVPYPSIAVDMRPLANAVGFFFPFNDLASEQIALFDKAIKGKRIKYFVPNMDRVMEAVKARGRSEPLFRIKEIGVMILGTSVRARKLSIRGDSLATTSLFWRIIKSLDEENADQKSWQTDSITASLASERSPSLSWNKLGYASMHVGKSLDYFARLSVFMQRMESEKLLDAVTTSPMPLMEPGEE